MINILILYAEIMPYNISNYYQLGNVLKHNFSVDVFHWGIDKKLTSYNFPDIPNFKFIVESEYSFERLKEYTLTKKYDIVYVCGRVEKKYLDISLLLRKNGSIIMGTSDEPYTGSFKQKVVRLFSYVLYRRYFHFVMIPGLPQYNYMRYLGFKHSQILMGSYSCDVYSKNLEYISRGREYPKQFKLLYVGRFEKEKGILELLEVIKKINEYNQIITLRLIGSGSLKDKIMCYNFVEVIDFTSHEKMYDYTLDVNYFILPSIKEPWGVVVHEFAAMGLPLILSNSVGSISQFLKHNLNGYSFNAKDKKSLAKAIHNAINIDEYAWKMQSLNSITLSKTINEKLWAQNMLKCIK